MQKHELKTWPEYYQAIKRGEKTFEIRKHDRPFQVGDKLLLKEYKLLGLNQLTQQIEGEYTGEEMELTITYVLRWEQYHNNFGLEKGHCIMGFLPVGVDALESNYQMWMKSEIKDDAMSWFLHNWLAKFKRIFERDGVSAGNGA